MLLLLAALPGLLARRVFYSGEFHRQFSAKNLILSLLYSVLIGIPILWIATGIYNNMIIEICNWEALSPQSLNRLFTQVFNSKLNKIEVVSLFFEVDFVLKILAFGGVVASVSAVSAYIGLKVVRAFELDIQIPFLRFENHWYYYLRGEFLKFKDFGIRFVKIIDVYADVLVKIDGKTKLYSGFLKQYTLKRDTNDLEAIYLTDVVRWNDNKEPKEVPSSCFIIPYHDVANINLRVVYLPDSRPAWRAKLKTLEPVVLFFTLITPFFINDEIFLNLPLLPMLQLILGLFLCSLIHLLKRFFFTDSKQRSENLFKVGMTSVLILAIIYGLAVGISTAIKTFV